MVQKLKGYYIKSKLKVLLLTTIMMVIIIISAVIAFAAGSDKLVIGYKGDTWDTSIAFNKTWYMNSADNNLLNFNVDLTDYLTTYKTDHSGTAPTIDKSDISITIKNSDNSVLSSGITVTPPIQGETTANYLVNADLSGFSTKDEIITVTVAFKTPDSWTSIIPSTEFTVTKDTVTTSNLADNIYFTNTNSITIPIDNYVSGDTSNVGTIANGNITFSSLISGDNDITCKFTDSAGNSQTQSITISYWPSFQSGLTCLVTDKDNIVNKQNIDVTSISYNTNPTRLNMNNSYLSISRGGNQVKKVYLKDISGDSYSYDTSKVNGVYSFKFHLVDKANNIVNIDAGDVICDYVKPSITTSIDSDISAGDNFYKSNNNITITSSDDFEINSANITNATINGSALDTSLITFNTIDSKTFSLDHSFAEAGIYSMKINTSDKAGNSTSSTISFTVDDTAPVIDISGATDNTTYVTDQTISVKVDETNYANNSVNIGVTKTLDGTTTAYNMGAWVNSTASSILNHKFTEEGTYSITVSSKDAAGNDAVNKTLTFTIDKVKPEISITGADQGSFNSADKNVSIKVVESNYGTNNVNIAVSKTIAGVETPFNMGTWANTGKNSTLSYNFTEEGTYAITTTSTDAIGNTADPKTIVFTIDKIKPEISISGAADGSFNNTDKNVSVNLTESNYANNEVIIGVTKTLDGTTTAYNMGTWANTAENSSLNHNFTEEGTYVVTVNSTDAAGNHADIKTLTFTIDKVKPLISITGAIAGSFNSADKNVSINVVESNYVNNTVNIGVTKTIDGIVTAYDMGNWENTAKASVLTHTFNQDGTYVVTVTSTDGSGNVADTQSLTVTVDKTKPVISISGTSNGTFNGGQKTVSVDVIESNYVNNTVSIGVTKTIDGILTAYNMGTWQNLSKDSRLSHTFNQEGTYVVTIDSTDLAGNVADTKTLYFTVDETKPLVSITGVQEGSFNGTDKNVSVNVIESNYENNTVNIGVTKTIDGVATVFNMGAWENTSKNSTLSHTFNQDGTYVITVSSIDASGNDGSVKTLSFTIDKTKPNISITGVTDGSFNGADKNVSINVEESNYGNNAVQLGVTKTTDGIVTACYMGNWENSGKKSSLNHTFDENGTYVVTLNSKDAAGNATDTKVTTFTIDKTKPEISITGADQGSFNNMDKNITIGVTESNYNNNAVNIKVTKTLDGVSMEYPFGLWTNTGIESKLNHNFTQEGTYLIEVTSVDRAGNQAIKKELNFTVDKIKPVISFTGVENNSFNKPSKQVNIGVTESNFTNNTVNISTTKTTLDGKTVGINLGEWRNAGKTSVLSYEFKDDATYVITVTSTDKAKNTTDSQNFTFTIDSKAPVITPKFKGENRGIKNNEYINKAFIPEFELDRTDVDNIVSVTLNGGNNIKNSIPLSSTDMVYTYKVMAIDKAGNEATLDLSYTVDLTTPIINISGVIDSFFKDDITPKIQYSDLYLEDSKTIITLNGEKYISGTKLSAEKDYKLFVSISDLAGNTTTRNVIFTLDKTQPQIKFVEEMNGKYFKNNIIPRFSVEDMTDYEIITRTLDGKDYDGKSEITQDGKHVLFLEVKDKAGNKKSVSIEFIMDQTPPKVIYSGVLNNTKYYSNVNFNIKLDNPNDKYKSIKVNGELFNGQINEDNSVSISETDIKKYTVEVITYDAATNETTSFFNFEITEKSTLVKLYENKPLFFALIGGSILLLASVVFFRLKKKVVVS